MPRNSEDVAMELVDEPKPTVEEEEKDALEVGAEDDDEPESKPSRREKRSERGKELIEAANRRAEAAEKMAAENARALRELATRPVYAQVQQPQAPQPDPYEYEAHTLRQQQQQLIRSYNEAVRAGNQQLVQQLETESYELKDRMDANTYVRMARRMGAPQAPQQPGMNRQEMERAIVTRRFADEHPDIAGDPKNSQAFSGNYNRLMAMGRPDSWDTLNEACEMTRKDMHLPGRNRPAPTAAQKSRFTGMGVGSSGAGAEGNKTIKMTPARRAMANAAFPHIKDENKRFQQWANTAGKNVPDP